MNKKADTETGLKTLLEELVQLYGLPKVIHSDQDVRITTARNCYRGVLHALGGQILAGTPYFCTKNPPCERQIRSFKTMVRILMAQEKVRNWLRVLPYTIYLITNQDFHGYWAVSARAILRATALPHGVPDAVGCEP